MNIKSSANFAGTIEDFDLRTITDAQAAELRHRSIAMA